MWLFYSSVCVCVCVCVSSLLHTIVLFDEVSAKLFPHLIWHTCIFSIFLVTVLLQVCLSLSLHNNPIWRGINKVNQRNQCFVLLFNINCVCPLFFTWKSLFDERSIELPFSHLNQHNFYSSAAMSCVSFILRNLDLQKTSWTSAAEQANGWSDVIQFVITRPLCDCEQWLLVRDGL